MLRWSRVFVVTAILAGLCALVPPGLAAASILIRPAVGVAATPDDRGYWEVASDGGIFAFGDAAFEGSMGGRGLNAPVVGMAATPDGKGYWEVASDGGIFNFGDAGFYGSTGSMTLNRPIVGMTTTPDGRGYWLVASDGGVFSYGDAGFYGSAGSLPLNKPVVGMAATHDGRGYWLVASDGGVFNYGDGGFYGSAGSLPLNKPVVGMATPWRPRVLVGGFRRGHLQLRGCRLLRLGRVAPPEQARGGHDGGGRRRRVLVGGFRRGHLRVRGRRVRGVGRRPPPPGPPRIALYGDSLGMEAGMAFTFLARAAGASALVRTYGGLAVCDFLASMASDVASWQPTAAVFEFSGDNFTPCMAGDPIGSPQYYAKYQTDLETSIDIFRAYGTEVFLIGIPFDASANTNQNVANLNQLYAAVAAANPGVTYIDAGQAVMANGAFTWTLPCLPSEPCTGPSGTNVVRAPDGVHFCPTGDTTIEGYFAICNVYSSGAFRFAEAMLGPALAS